MSEHPAKRRRRAGHLAPLHPDVVPESKQYLELLEFEKQLDSLMARKKIEYSDTLRKPPAQLKRNLRIFLSCAVENDEATGGTAWTLRIDGKLLDDEKRTYTSKRKFSSFLRRMYVEFNGNGSADEAAAKPAEWQRSASVGDSDGFDLTRTSSGGVPAGHVDAKILLHLMHSPAKFELKKELADMIGLFHATRHEAIAALWQYIKERKLQDREEPEWINCDDYMQRVFPGVARMKFTDIPSQLDRVLLPLSPVVLHYKIPMELGQHKREIYDLEVEVDDPNRDVMATMFDSIDGEVRVLDSQVAVLKRELDESREKREFMLNFSRDPKEFLASWLASQARENNAVAAVGTLSEEQRAAPFYTDHRAQEAVYRYYATVLQKRTKELSEQTTKKKAK